LYTPEADGGLSLSRLDATVVFEELASACPSTAAFLTIHNMVSWMVASWATPAVKAVWCEALASGRKIGSYCLTEPGAGSDAGSLKTTAKLVDGHYVINGSKAFISGAGATDVLVLMARTGGEGPKGISALVVPADTAGISYGKKEVKMGWNSQPTRTISFDNVRVPADHLLGQEGEGFKFAMKGLDGGRINIATCSVGAAQAALNAAHAYMKERRQFNRPLADFQALQFKLADMQTELVAARQWCVWQPASSTPVPPTLPPIAPWPSAWRLISGSRSAMKRCKFMAATATSANIRWSVISAMYACIRFWKAPTKSCGSSLPVTY